MNHLREFLEEYASGNVFSISGLPKSADDFANIAVTGVAEQSMCFFAEIDALAGMKPVKELCERLPFNACWFEFQITQPRSAFVCVLAVQKADAPGATWIIFRKMTGEWSLLGAARTGDGNLACYTAPEFGSAWVQEIVNAARVYITAMRCSNVAQAENKPSAALQSSRAKKGKPPLFSYWTLTLKNERSEDSSLGGTHAPPRLHLRRGHPRQYAAGKWTWVQPCVVGNKDLGMVHKDYRLAGLPHNDTGNGPRQAALAEGPR